MDPSNSLVIETHNLRKAYQVASLIPTSLSILGRLM